MMSLQEEKISAAVYFKQYSSEVVKLNIGDYKPAILASYQGLIEHGIANLRINNIDPKLIDKLLECSPEVVIIGTGAKQQIPPVEIIAKLADAGLSLDFMSSEAACKTFNLLVNENRHVSCLIL